MAARAPRLLPHVLVAGAILLAVAWWTGADGQVSVDEGVAVKQAEAVADGTWVLPHPLEVADPDGSAFPLRFATRTDDGYVPFAKHPLYPAVLSVADRVGGVRAMVGLSLVGVLGAAVAAAALARRLDPRLPVPTVYAVALGSPLLFDS
ncbi:MAG TPA: hypothetical protein VJ804_02625, partial [Acidimicrobiales bacterium]|nr:hypothetical protein [Acidimicrobiales bacterium]